MVLAALGLLFAEGRARGAVLARRDDLPGVLYFAQDAPFLGVVQVVVYTGAVMMLFLFVLMLVGVDSSDSLVETIRGQRGGRRSCSASASASCSSSASARGTSARPRAWTRRNADGNVTTWPS